MALDGLSANETGVESHLVQDEEKANGKDEGHNGNMKHDFGVDVKIKQNRRNGPVKSLCTRGKRCVTVVICLLLMLAVGTAVTVLVVYITKGPHIQVILPMGILRGRVVSAPQGGEVEQFLGVPFAQPPVGKLRYADPVPLQAFPSEIYEASDYKYSCMQHIDDTFGDFRGSDMWNAPNKVQEDCLYMNIWVPAESTKQRKAVMVWIYGGGFFAGSNALWVYDGKALATHGDVIVVSFNYRLGTFGYLSTGDGRIKGNFGMKDQVLALTWIKQNIYHFGGDPERITIFGESSGASSAGLHMMSDMSHHLFKRAIFESGSPDSHWSFMTNTQAEERSKKFFRNVNCSSVDTDELLSCLRKLDARSILNNEWVDSHFMVFPWAPSVDGAFLTDTPYNLLRNGAFEPKQTILGVNRDEGTYWLLYALEAFNKNTESLQSFEEFQQGVDTVAWDLSRNTRDEIVNLYKNQEIMDISNHAANRDALDKVCGDRSFTCPTKQLAEIYARKHNSTYLYYLTYRASNEVWPDWMGVIHGAEIQWVFGMPLNKSRGYTKAEVEFSKNIMEYWSNFAKTGDPNSAALAHWPQHGSGQYVEWRGPRDTMVHSTHTLRAQFCQLWQDINRKINLQIDV